MQNSRAVHMNHSHINSRGDCMERKYDATYRFPGSKGVVHVVAPPPMTEEEVNNVLREYDKAFWAAWKSLSTEQKLKINARCEDASQSK